MHLYFILFYFIPIFLTKEILYSFPFREFNFLDCKLCVGAGITTLMSVSYIVCRKMEKARPMKEDVDGKVFFFPARVGICNL